MYLGMKERRVVYGEELGPAATSVEAVAYGGGTDEEAEAEDRAVHAARVPAEPHGVQMQHLAPDPRPDDTLCPPQLRPALGLRPHAEEGPQRLEAEAEALRPGGVHDLGHSGHRRRPLGGVRQQRSHGRYLSANEERGGRHGSSEAKASGGERRRKGSGSGIAVDPVWFP